MTGYRTARPGDQAETAVTTLPTAAPRDRLPALPVRGDPPLSRRERTGRLTINSVRDILGVTHRAATLNIEKLVEISLLVEVATTSTATVAG
jgi:hypothetical protein